jgi:hypothetical protein
VAAGLNSRLKEILFGRKVKTYFMLLRFFSLYVLLFVTFAAHGQESPIHNQTTPPPNAKFEIVQSQIAAKYTFRLDRFTGQVSQLVHTSTGGNSWENMRVIDASKASTNTYPHFQIFLSGIAAKHSFLIDTDSGNTWTLTTLTDDAGKETEVVWKPFEE